MKYPFDGDFDRSKNYLISGKDLVSWKAAYLADRVVPGRGIEVTGTPQGRIIHAAPGVEATICTLGSILTDPDNAGQQRIAPGFISGGGSTIDLVFANFLPADGDYYYIEVTWTGAVEDDVLIPGGTMDAAEIKKGVSVPDDHTFTKAAATGKFHIPLGIWNNSALEDASCGNVGVCMCPNEPRFWRI